MKELNLHFVKHDDVDRLVENFSLLHFASSLRIITGHSHRMKELVIKVLERHNFNYESNPNDGWIIVRGNK